MVHLLNTKYYPQFDSALAAIPYNTKEVSASANSKIWAPSTNLIDFFRALGEKRVKRLNLQANNLYFRLFKSPCGALLQEAFEVLPPLDELDVCENNFDTPLQKVQFIALLPNTVTNIVFDHPTLRFESESFSGDLRFAKLVGKLANAFLKGLKEIKDLSYTRELEIISNFSMLININYNESSEFLAFIDTWLSDLERELIPSYDPRLLPPSKVPLIAAIKEMLTKDFSYSSIKRVPPFSANE